MSSNPQDTVGPPPVPRVRLEDRRDRVCVMTPCFNEADNVPELVERVVAAFATVPDCDYEILMIDNASTDGTADVIKRLAQDNPRIKLIVNERNFGHIKLRQHTARPPRHRT